MRLQLFKNEIKDTFTRENFRKIDEVFKQEPILNGAFKFFQIVLPASVNNLNYNHHLGFLPRDVIELSVSNGQAVIWNYDSFTDTFIQFTTTGACTIRAFIGTYREGGSL